MADDHAGDPGPAQRISFDQRLRQIEERLRNGEKVPPVTVRELLRWRGWERRGSFVSSWIQRSLREANLTTSPDFTVPYIDALIEFQLADNTVADSGAQPTPTDAVVASGTTPGSDGEISAPPSTVADPTYRIERLRSANLVPTSVTPNHTVTEAITIMLTNDFSQLPVMMGERDVKGVISWTSIGSRLVLGVKFEEVRECMEAAHVIPADTSLLDAITEIVNNQYVLVRDGANKICGIVTTSDLSREFRQLTEPFVLLGEIENHVRSLILRGEFSNKQLSECCDPSVLNQRYV